MKTKGHPKKNVSHESDRFDRKSVKTKSSTKDKSTKRRLSIYDDFDEEEEDWSSTDSDEDDLDDD